MFEQIVRLDSVALPQATHDDPSRHNEPISKTLAWAVAFMLIGGVMALLGLWMFACHGPKGGNGAVIMWVGALAAIYFSKRQFVNGYMEFLDRRDAYDESDTINYYPDLTPV